MKKNTKKNNTPKKNNVPTVEEKFHHAIYWMRDAIGRFHRLQNIKAPYIILYNERSVWAEHYATCVDMIKSGEICLNAEGKKLFIKISKYYRSLPSRISLLYRFASDPNTKQEEWMEKINDLITTQRVLNEVKAQEVIDRELDKMTP